MSFSRHSYLLVWHSYVICMPLLCVCKSSVCTRIPFVCNRMYTYAIWCHSWILVSHPYHTHMYSYVIRMSLVCARMSSVCQSYLVLPWTLLKCFHSKICFLYNSHLSEGSIFSFKFKKTHSLCQDMRFLLAFPWQLVNLKYSTKFSLRAWKRQKNYVVCNYVLRDNSKITPKTNVKIIFLRWCREMSPKSEFWKDGYCAFHRKK